jgi:hypothetical protein
LIAIGTEKNVHPMYEARLGRVAGFGVVAGAGFSDDAVMTAT